MSINFIIGYFIGINLVSYIFIWLKIRTNIIKINDGTIDFIYVLLSILGGFIGILIPSEMFNYRRDDKLFKRIIPFVIVIEIAIIGYIIYKVNK